MLLGSIGAGGIKCVCAVGNENLEIIDRISFATTTPQETVRRAIAYFQQFDQLAALSVASFGPIEIRPTNEWYGYITDTPKVGWSRFNFLQMLKEAFQIPIYWTTDVNGSAYGEYVVAQREDRPVTSIVYYTIGTGVGAGIVIDGHFVGDGGHPEVGHVRLKRHPDDLAFPGICPYHGDCLEGLVAGPTFEARTGKPGAQVPLSDPVWDIMAYYVAQATLQATLFIRPARIILGGGVMSQPFLAKIQVQFEQLMNGYFDIGHTDDYLTMPTVVDNGSATVGNFALAARQFDHQ